MRLKHECNRMPDDVEIENNTNHPTWGYRMLVDGLYEGGKTYVFIRYCPFCGKALWEEGHESVINDRKNEPFSCMDCNPVVMPLCKKCGGA